MHEEDLFNVCMRDVKRDLRRGIIECSKRGLQQSAKWLAELNYFVKCPPDDPLDASPHFEGIDPRELDTYYMAKSFYDVREYDRAAHFLSECQSPVPKFLHFYSVYMAREKRKQDNVTEELILENCSSASGGKNGIVPDRGLTDLMDTLKQEHNENKLDGYCLYLYGVVLKKLDLNEHAVTAIDIHSRLL